MTEKKEFERNRRERQGARGLIAMSALVLTAIGSAERAFGEETNEVEVSPATLEVRDARFRVLAVVQGDVEAVQAGELPPGDLIRVDRGSRDGVQLGASVEFTPKGSERQSGTVVKVEERVCLVLPRAPESAHLLMPGVGGTVQVETQGAPPIPDASDQERQLPNSSSDSNTVQEDGRPEWLRLRDSWSQDMPLLANVRPETPSQRPFAWGGRMYLQTGVATAFASERGDAALRSGVDVWASNPFGWGGEAELDGEYDLRALWVPEEDGEGEGRSRLRVDRMSYTYGADRYHSEGHRFGRFLQAMPELGVLDGYEWQNRLQGGDTFGASLGYLAERDFDAATGHNFATSVFYKWVADEREVLTASGAFSKSFHNGDRDRDLFVLRSDYRPRPDLRGDRPWDLHMAMLLDRYSGEDAEGDGLGLTRFSVETRKEHGGVNGNANDVRVNFRHQESPEALYFDLEPLTLAALIRDREDRLGVSTSQWVEIDRRVHGFAGIWEAGGLEQDHGGDLELGLELLGIEGVGPGEGDGIADVTAFASHGRFNTTTGFHCSYGRRWDGVGWELLYEFALSDQDGFADTTDDIFQHRIRLTADIATLGGWSVAGHGDLLSYGDDGNVAIGVYCGRSF